MEAIPPRMLRTPRRHRDRHMVRPQIQFPPGGAIAEHRNCPEPPRATRSHVAVHPCENDAGARRRPPVCIISRVSIVAGGRLVVTPLLGRTCRQPASPSSDSAHASQYSDKEVR
jgi:hypothetical protein